jgi:DNA repair protein RecN (Recombination protein N)
MLSDLSIQNFVLIDSAQLKFRNGLNVLTGETGAGKTIVMDALSMVLGERANSDLIRQGTDQATVEAVFELDPKAPGFKRLIHYLEESGLEAGDTLILKRTLNRAGKNRCYVNNSTTTLSTLGEIGGMMVDLHGQHEHQTLLNSKNYLEILDDFGELGREGETIRLVYEQWRETNQKYLDLTTQERERHRLLDQLQFQISEIEQAALRPGEEEELASERRKLRNFESLNEHTANILALLEGKGDETPGVIESLGQIQSRVEDMAQRDPDLSEARNLTENATYTLEELLTKLRIYNEALEFQPGRLDEIEARLHLIHNLKKKYGGTIEEVLSFLGESKTEFDRLENFEEERANYEKQLQTLTENLGQQATELSKKRRKIAKQMCGEITLELRQLGMQSARFEVEVVRIDPATAPTTLRMRYPQDDESPITPKGWDNLHFKISTNPGEPLKTLKQVASGGEISRVMLAIKAVLSRIDGVDVLVFDEIDSGIGGKTAHVVGGKIKTLAGERQVLCITHLAPIASRADHHLRIEKETDGQTTRIRISPLEGQSRAEELARMMGADATEGSLRLAEEMLQQAGK